MSAFYVGQRVRIKWSRGWPELAGKEGRIVAANPGANVHGKPSEWLVAPDCWGSEHAPRIGRHGGARFGPSSDQLEPIVDDGRQVISWSECLWRPEGVAA